MRPRLERRRCRRKRRMLGVMVLAAPVLWIVVSDVARRWDHLSGYDALHQQAYLATILASAVFWPVVLFASARQRRTAGRDLCAGVFALLFTLSVGVQAAFHGLYAIYLSHDAQIYAQSFPQALLGYLPLSSPRVLGWLALHLVIALSLLSLARVWLRPRRRARLAIVAVPVVLVAITQLPASFRMWQSTTPDIIYFHGLVSHVKERLGYTLHAPDVKVQRRDPVEVPPMRPAPARPRNVLFILQESLRYDISCNAYDPTADDVRPPKCATPFSNAAAPDRLPLDQLRANASTTAISINNLWSGVPQHLSMETLLSVPLLWDFADAAGYSTAYWTSQNVMFGGMRLYVQDLPLDFRAFATHLDSYAGFDEGALDVLLTERVIADWEALPEPFFAVVHYSNVHFPYVYDEEFAPFQPSAFTKAADKNQHFINYYKNVAYLSDRSVARLIEHVHASDKGARTLMLYTSDHGEAFREHWQLGHTSSLYDEEIKVPAWIDAPEGTLSEDERASIVAARDEFAWHFDLPPTVLDLLGIWDAPEMRPFRANMVGSPLTRRQRTTRPVPLNNCSWLWECGFRNWGMMQGHMKIEAREWDNAFNCFDLLADPGEEVNLGEAACAPLPDIARATFGAMPFQEWPSQREEVFGDIPHASEPEL